MPARNMPDRAGRWYTIYTVDKGCRLHPHCLTCPRPMCKHDEELLKEVAVDVILNTETEATLLEGANEERGRCDPTPL